MYFKQLFEEKLAQYSYLVGCQATGEAIIIDPMRDIDQYFELAAREGLRLIAAADTHIHADYVSGLEELAARGIKIYASDEGDADWKYNWLSGSNYDFHLLKDGDEIKIGNLILKAVHTPGHTPEHISYLLTDGAAADEPMGMLSGDFVFVGDVGRPDLLESAAGQAGAMEPSARRLFQSLQEFKKLPDYMKIWPAHGAGSACGKALGAVPDSTVGYEKRFSPAIGATNDENGFVNFILDGQPEPPLYFARMKKVNKDGIGVLGHLPQPIHFEKHEIIDRTEKGAAVLDTRHQGDFAESHWKGSILATYNKSFNTVAGSYITPGTPVILLIEKHNVEKAVRDLVRVGVDNIVGFFTPNNFDTFREDDNNLPIESVHMVDFNEVEAVYQNDDVMVLDVRKAVEHSPAHVPNAKNISHTRLKAHIDEIPTDKTIYVHCQMGGRAAAAASLLLHHGRKVVYVNDAFANWNKAHNQSAVLA